MRKLRFDLNVETNALLCPNPQEFYSKCYITEDIVNNYRTIPGVKTSTKVANVLFSDILKASACNFTGVEDQALDAIDIDVVAVSALASLCRFDLESSFVSLQMAQGSNGSFEVASFMSYYWDEMAKEIQAEVATLRWQGDTAGATTTYLDLVDGYEKKFLADGDIVPVTGTTITVANVITEMTKVYQALDPACLAKKDDLRLYVSANVAVAYEIAAAQGNTIAYVTEALKLSFAGIKMVVNPGMSNNTMVLTNKMNLIYAFDGEGDATALKAVNLEDTIAEPILRTRTNLKLGFFYTNPTEIVFYSPLAS